METDPTDSPKIRTTPEVGRNKTHEDFKSCRFARTVGTEKTEDLALLHTQAEIIQLLEQDVFFQKPTLKSLVRSSISIIDIPTPHEKYRHYRCLV